MITHRFQKAYHRVFRRLTVPRELGQSDFSWFLNLPPIIVSRLKDEGLDKILQDFKTCMLALGAIELPHDNPTAPCRALQVVGDRAQKYMRDTVVTAHCQDIIHTLVI
jgi:hypothetical protein